MSFFRGLATVLLLRGAGPVLAHASVALAMVMLWADPMVFGPDMAGNLELMMVMEFVILHSTAFLVAFRFMKGFPRWVIILMYAPFGIFIALALSSWLVLALFVWHLAAGVWGDFDTAERNVGAFLVRYVPTFAWFVFVPFLVVLLRLPALGWEEYPSLAFRTDEGFSSQMLIPAWTTFYFAGRAVWEVAVRQWERSGSLYRFIDKVRQT